MTQMQEAIQSGRNEAVDDLLRGMTKPQQKMQLCATYGGSEDSPGSPDANDLYVRTSPMLHAARCGNSEAFSTLLHAARGMLKSQLKATDGIGRTVLAMAALSGKQDTFSTVFAAVKRELNPVEVNAMIRAKDCRNNSLFAFAAESADKDAFETVQEFLEQELTEKEMYDLIAPEEYLGNRLLLQAVKPDKGKDLGLLKAVLKAVGRCINNDPQGDWIERGRELRGQELLCQAIRFCEIDLFQRTPRFVEEHLADTKAAESIKAIFSHWVNKSRSEQTILTVDEHTGEKIEEFFQNLLRGNKLLDWVKTCLSGPLVCSKNPFIPGLTLSVAFSRAAEDAPEGERRNLLSLQKTVDDFLLEVLERLPQTVRGCKRRMSCSALFEPTLPEGRLGPLEMMVSKQKQRLIFCKVPLVMDYLSLRFSCGLPGLLDTDGILRDREVLGNLVKTNGGLVLDDTLLKERNALDELEHPAEFQGKHDMLLHLRHPLVLLQGADPDFPGLAGIPIVGRCPGLQFITAGIVARPGQYYRVPVLRMTLDFVVYLVMLTVFSFFVLVQSDGELTWGEIIFFVSFVVVGVIREVREMMRNLEAYLEDRWNILDVLGLAVLLAGFVIRSTDSTSPWGQALYALSAPLVFSRVLFFAQILHFQGPMIQVIFSMTGELIQFGVVMLVVMLGFVMAFFALFSDVDSFGLTCLSLFKAMLGEVGLFDDFGEKIRDRVATALLIVYLVIMNIMFLNLLIAVLSTSYSKVEEDAETEFKVSKARMIQHCEMKVENDLLPAPFSLVQLVVSWSFALVGGNGQNAKHIFGQVVFWLVLGPVAVVAGILLWILSVFYAPCAWTKHYLAQSKHAPSQQPLCPWITFIVMQWLVIILWCGLLAPLYLVVMWIRAPLWAALEWLNGSCFGGQGNRSSYDVIGSTGFLPDVGAPDHFDVNKILLTAAGGVNTRDLFGYLVDPMSDPEVRQGEVNRQTTVEHIKLLRNRLEGASKKQADELRAVKKEIKETEQRLEQKLDEVMHILGKAGQPPQANIGDST